MVDSNTTQRIHNYLLPPTPGRVVDHINRNPADNRIANLRLATATENAHNRTKAVDTSSRWMGACKIIDTEAANTSSRWVAFIAKDGIRYNLGCYGTEAEAALAYNLKAQDLYADHANLNALDPKFIADNSVAVRRRMEEGADVSSRWRCVTFQNLSKKWRTTLMVDKQVYNLGEFTDELVAAQAVNDKLVELVGADAALTHQSYNHGLPAGIQVPKREYTSQFVGVSFHKASKRYRAAITFQKKRIHIGIYASPEAAALAFNTKAVELYGPEAGQHVKLYDV